MLITRLTEKNAYIEFAVSANASASSTIMAMFTANVYQLIVKAVRSISAIPRSEPPQKPSHCATPVCVTVTSRAGFHSAAFIWTSIRLLRLTSTTAECVYIPASMAAGVRIFR